MDSNELNGMVCACVEKSGLMLSSFRFSLASMTLLHDAVFCLSSTTSIVSHSHFILDTTAEQASAPGATECQTVRWNVIFIQAHRNLDTFCEFVCACVLHCINKTRCVLFAYYQLQRIV